MPISERRGYPRTEVELMVLFPGGRGQTLNISAGGLVLETDSIDGLLGREVVPLEIHLEQRPPFAPAIVLGDGTVLRMRRRAKQRAGEGKEEAPKWEVALKFKSPMEVCNFQ